MKKDRTQRKAELMARFEAEVEKLLDWQEENPRPTLKEIEDTALQRRQAIGRVMTEDLLQGQDNVQPSPRVNCPTCGEEMHAKGRKRKNVLTRLGDVDMERCYYYCSRCKRGFSPPR